MPLKGRTQLERVGARKKWREGGRGEGREGGREGRFMFINL